MVNKMTEKARHEEAWINILFNEVMEDAMDALLQEDIDLSERKWTAQMVLNLLNRTNIGGYRLKHYTGYGGPAPEVKIPYFTVEEYVSKKVMLQKATQYWKKEEETEKAKGRRRA